MENLTEQAHYYIQCLLTCGDGRNGEMEDYQSYRISPHLHLEAKEAKRKTVYYGV